MYLLQIEKLKAGDILLTSGNKLHSKIIKKVTKSNFSHAILYVGDGSYIHSDGKGVHSNNIQRLLFNKPTDVRVLRVYDSKLAILACNFARTQIGKQYSVKDAIKTKISFNNKMTNRQFCSRLVAQAYASVGLKIVNNPSYCTPQELNDSILTREIKNCVKKATQEEIKFSKSESPLERQFIITNDILSRVRDLTKCDIQSLSEIDEFILKNQKYDSEITKIIKDSGYLTMWNGEFDTNRWRYDGEIFLSLPISVDKKRQLAQRELEFAKNMLERCMLNLKGYSYMVDISSLQYAQINKDLYKTLTEIQLIRLAAAEYVLELTKPCSL